MILRKINHILSQCRTVIQPRFKLGLLNSNKNHLNQQNKCRQGVRISFLLQTYRSSMPENFSSLRRVSAWRDLRCLVSSLLRKPKPQCLLTPGLAGLLQSLEGFLATCLARNIMAAAGGFLFLPLTHICNMHSNISASPDI